MAEKELTKRLLKKIGRKKRAKRLQDDKEFAKSYFDQKSKNSIARKLAFRRRHSAK